VKSDIENSQLFSWRPEQDFDYHQAPPLGVSQLNIQCAVESVSGTRLDETTLAQNVFLIKEIRIDFDQRKHNPWWSDDRS
jgi:hypothetical protein